MAYEEFTFDGKPINYVMSYNRNIRKGTITLNCYADNGEGDPKDVINGWREYESQIATGEMTLDDGMDLQSYGVTFYELSNKVNTWKAVLLKVDFKTDSFGEKLILFTMDFLITEGDISGYGNVYLPNTDHNNLNYKLNVGDSAVYHVLGDTFGEVEITESLPIKKVTVIGGGLTLPSYVEVNDEKKYWHTVFDENNPETLTFYITGIKKVTIISPQTQDINNPYGGSQINMIGIKTKNADYIAQGV